MLHGIERLLSFTEVTCSRWRVRLVCSLNGGAIYRGWRLVIRVWVQRRGGIVLRRPSIPSNAPLSVEPSFKRCLISSWRKVVLFYLWGLAQCAAATVVRLILVCIDHRWEYETGTTILACDWAISHCSCIISLTRMAAVCVWVSGWQSLISSS